MSSSKSFRIAGDGIYDCVEEEQVNLVSKQELTRLTRIPGEHVSRQYISALMPTVSKKTWDRYKSEKSLAYTIFSSMSRDFGTKHVMGPIKSSFVTGARLRSEEARVCKASKIKSDKFQDWLDDAAPYLDIDKQIGRPRYKYHNRSFGRRTKLINGARILCKWNEYDKEILDMAYQVSKLDLDALAGQLRDVSIDDDHFGMIHRCNIIKIEKEEIPWLPCSLMVIDCKPSDWFAEFLERVNITIFGIEYCTYFAFPLLKFLASYRAFDNDDPLLKQRLNEVCRREECRITGKRMMERGKNDEIMNFHLIPEDMDLLDDFYAFCAFRELSHKASKLSDIEDWKDCPYVHMREYLVYIARNADPNDCPSDKQKQGWYQEYDKTNPVNHSSASEFRCMKNREDKYELLKTVRERGARTARSDRDIQEKHLFGSDIRGVVKQGQLCLAKNDRNEIEIVPTENSTALVRYKDIALTREANKSLIISTRRKQVKETREFLGKSKYEVVPRGMLVYRSCINKTVLGNGIEVALIKDIDYARAERVRENQRNRKSKLDDIEELRRQNNFEIIPVGLVVERWIREGEKYDWRTTGLPKLITGDGVQTACLLSLLLILGSSTTKCFCNTCLYSLLSYIRSFLIKFKLDEILH